jgi:glucan phosphoethanolaminetransferase (alkaline phosphatase superfamily)
VFGALDVGYRVMHWDGYLALGWTLLAFLNLLTNSLRYHTPLILLETAIVSGMAFGIFLFSWVSLKTLRTIEKKGVYSVSLITWMYLAGALLISIGLIIWVFITLPLQSSIVVLDFLYPTLPAALLTRMLLYWRWEHKNNRMIFTTWGFSGKVYAYPYITNTA